MKKTWKRWVTLLMTICLMAAMLVPVTATESSSTGSTEDPADGILTVWLEYVDDNGNVTQLSGGTCFLINDEYVLTNYHVLDLSQEVELSDGTETTLREYAMLLLGLSSLSDSDSHLRISVYANRDTRSTATVHENVQSEDSDFVALKLASKIYDRTPLVLGDSDTLSAGDDVLAYGFPADSITNKEYNTKDDVSVTKGNVSKMTTTGNIDYIEHTAELNSGNSGGPLVNEAGEVVGINSFTIGNDLGSKYYAIQINVVKSILNTWGISYTDASSVSSSSSTSDDDDDTDTDTAADTTETEVATVVTEEYASEDKLEELKETIEEAEELLKSGSYTDETTEALEDAIDDAEDVYDSGTATDDDVDDAIDDLEDAMKALEKKGGVSMLMIGIGIAIVVVIVLIVVLVIMNNKKKKKQQPEIDDGGYGGYGGGYGGGGQPGGGGTSTIYGGQGGGYGTDDGAGATTILDQGAGATTVLGAGAAGGGSAYLIRKKNGEKIMINNPSFAIGKERKRVNYCISDNTSVSRYHAVISRKGADYYIVDQQSSNFTYVNGVQVSPYAETLLTDRSVIKLSDEEFEFHLS